MKSLSTLADSWDRQVTILPITLLTAAFIRIAYRTGEKPRWRWGED